MGAPCDATPWVFVNLQGGWDVNQREESPQTPEPKVPQGSLSPSQFAQLERYIASQ